MEAEKPVPPHRRDLLLRVMDNQLDLGPLLYNFYCHVQCDEMLRWMIKNRKTGHECRSFLLIEHGNSMLLLMAHIQKELRRDLELKPILIGRDFKTV